MARRRLTRETTPQKSKANETGKERWQEKGGREEGVIKKK